METPTTILPLTVLTGFLGSGKTTLLKRLLHDPAMAGTAVVINEFGEVGIDDAIVARGDEGLVTLASGCVCCSVRGDLAQALDTLYSRALWKAIPMPRRVVLETTGLADPAPIVHTLMTTEELYRVYRLDGVVTTIDAQHGAAQLEREYEPAKQAAIADRLVVTKTDLVARAEVERLVARVRQLNARAPIIEAVKGEIAPNRLFSLGAFEPAVEGKDVSAWLGSGAEEGQAHAHDHACAGGECAHPDHLHAHDHGHHDHGHGHGGHLHGIGSFALEFTSPIPYGALAQSVGMLVQMHGERLLRVKGIVDVEGESQPVVIHGVQHVFYAPDRLDAWPGTERRSRLVFITRDLAEAEVRALLRPFLGEAAVP